MNCNCKKKFKCKNKIIIQLSNCNVCYNHFNLLFKPFIIKIQKCYMGYKTRKKLKKLYYNLPKDIQKIVLYYINLPIYCDKYYKKLQYIIYKKTNQLFNSNIKFNIYYIIRNFNLLNKYYQILDLNYLKYNYIISKDILYELRNDYYLFIYNLDNNNLEYYDDLNSNYIFIDNDYTLLNIIKCITIINKYIITYEKNYNLITRIY